MNTTYIYIYQTMDNAQPNTGITNQTSDNDNRQIFLEFFRFPAWLHKEGSRNMPNKFLITTATINCILHLPPEYTCPFCNGPMWVPILSAPVLVSTWRRIVPSPKNSGFRASTTIVSKYVLQSEWGSSGCKQIH